MSDECQRAYSRGYSKGLREGEGCLEYIMDGVLGWLPGTKEWESFMAGVRDGIQERYRGSKKDDSAETEDSDESESYSGGQSSSWVRDSYSDSYTAPPSKPPPPIKPETNWQRATFIGVAAFLLWFDYEIAVCWAGDHYDVSFIGMVVRGVGNVCFNERRNFPSILRYLGDFHLPSQQVFTLAFFAHYIIFPGVFLLWPAIKLISIATRELERKDKKIP
jgi:hypothetical protein